MVKLLLVELVEVAHIVARVVELHLVLLVHVVVVHLVVLVMSLLVHVKHSVELLLLVSILNVINLEVGAVAHLNGGLHQVGVVEQEHLLVHIQVLVVVTDSVQIVMSSSIKSHVVELTHVHVVAHLVVHVKVVISHDAVDVVVVFGCFSSWTLTDVVVDRVHRVVVSQHVALKVVGLIVWQPLSRSNVS